MYKFIFKGIWSYRQKLLGVGEGDCRFMFYRDRVSEQDGDKVIFMDGVDCVYIMKVCVFLNVC